jgi:hypothetical protein
MIKKWNPKTILIGFKFEVGITTEELKELARGSIEKNGCDLVVANDKQEMTTLKTHRAHFVFSPSMEETYKFNPIVVDGKDQIATEISDFLNRVLI